MATINSVSPNIRDFLLSRNLILSNSITQNGFTSQANGLGLPAEISTGNDSVTDQPLLNDVGNQYRNLNLANNNYRTQDNLEIQITNTQLNSNLPPSSQPVEYNSSPESQLELISDSQAYRDLNTASNLYLDTEQQNVIDINQSNLTVIQQMGSYLDENNNIKIAGIGTDNINVLGAIINGRGVGISSNGSLEPNFDVRGSISGRVLGAAGLINDTPIGIIGARELAFAVANNALFNLQEKVELNPINLIKGASFVREKFNITVPFENSVTSNIVETVLGYKKPVSQLDISSSIFQSENPVNSHLRNLNMIKNTGKGQSIQLFNNLNGNLYKPGYSVTEDNIEEGITSPNIYMGDIGGGEFIDLINDNKLDEVSQNSFKPNTFSDEFDSIDNVTINGFKIDFTWGDTNYNRDASILINQENIFNNGKSLLSKTRNIFKSDRMKTLTSGRFIGEQSSQINSTVDTAAGSVMSKGSGVVSYDDNFIRETDPERMFCRTWTTFRRYDSIRDLQKNTGLINYKGIRRNIGDSVLQDNGMPKIVPYSTDVIANETKKFMFSIENLAWADNVSDLPQCELGNGDLTTGTKGRIMWFPPYEIDFTDNTTVNWDATNFIGRGEPVYTYNNTERLGTLSFKIIADYASYQNDLKNLNASREIDREIDNGLYASIVAGCTDFNNNITSRLTNNEVNQINVDNNVKSEEVVADKTISFEDVSIYFSNDSATINKDYEDGENNGYITHDGLGSTFGEGFTNKKGTTFEDMTDFGLNKPFFEAGGQAERLKAFLRDECPACEIQIKGYASTQGNSESNQDLSSERAISVKQYFLDNIIEPSDPNRDKRVTTTIGEGETGLKLTNSNRRDSQGAKEARKVDVFLQYNPNLDKTVKDVKPKETPLNNNVTLNNETVSRFVDECAYFEKMEQKTPFLYKRLTEKFKYFHPAFHSITPEGLNSRMTFLQQCTRQGPTFTKNGKEQPNNLAFGRPPVCILRIGDFYHTKIVIDNLNFTFEPLVWDLNPEGVGVQPMIVNVDISFKFIGGSSLSGPINKLQNAISFNYFANTEIYDTRSDTLRPKTKEELKDNPLGTHTIQEGMSINEINNTTDNSIKTGIDPNNNNRPSTNQMERNENESSNTIGQSNTNTSNNVSRRDEEIIRSLQFFNVIIASNNLIYDYKSSLNLNENDNLSRDYRVNISLLNSSDNELRNIFTGSMKSGTGNPNSVSTGDILLLSNNMNIFTKTINGVGDIESGKIYVLIVKIGKIERRYPITI